MKLSGIVVPIATPLNTDECVDQGSLRRVVRYLLESGVHGILANGSMGGFAHLADREQMVALETILSEVNGRVPVVANVGENGTRRALDKAHDFETLNPDFLSFLPPFYFSISQPELKHFYKQLIDSVQTPTFLYDNPITTKHDLHLETIFELGEHPNVAGIKESKQDFDKWMRLVRHFRETSFAVFVGTETLVDAALIMGCDGIVAGLHNLCPHVAVGVYQAVREGNKERARKGQETLNKLFTIFQHGNLWGAFELAMRHLGLCEKVTSSPFRAELDAEIQLQIIEVLEQTLGGQKRSAAQANFVI